MSVCTDVISTFYKISELLLSSNRRWYAFSGIVFGILFSRRWRVKTRNAKCVVYLSIRPISYWLMFRFPLVGNNKPQNANCFHQFAVVLAIIQPSSGLTTRKTQSTKNVPRQHDVSLSESLHITAMTNRNKKLLTTNKKNSLDPCLQILAKYCAIFFLGFF